MSLHWVAATEAQAMFMEDAAAVSSKLNLFHSDVTYGDGVHGTRSKGELASAQGRRPLNMWWYAMTHYSHM